LRDSHSYGVVLLLIVTSFIFTIAAPDEPWSLSVLVLLQCATLGVALRTSGIGKEFRPVPVLLAAGVVAATLQLIAGGDNLDGIIGLLNFALLLSSAVVIALGVVDQREVNRRSIVGAVCIYLLIGMLFTFLYGALAHLDDGPFFAQGTDGTLSIRLYFSFVTLATLGYGDYTPAGDLGRALAITEALSGQLYLVTVVALLVGNIGRRKTEAA
jgi:Ion channel